MSGVCLTATEVRPEENILIGLLPLGSLRSTYLGALEPGDKVNLERASEVGGRNSGHFVQGNVDSWGRIIERQDGESLLLKIEVPAELLKYIVPKGLVAIDGTSLTVYEVNHSECWFTFVPVASSASVIYGKNVGDPVNVEVDVLGKYSENAMLALIPRIEELEKRYRQLQAKTTLLEAVNAELEQKIQSLENVRLLDNGARNVIPKAKMVGGPTAKKVNEDWIKEQQKEGKAKMVGGPTAKKVDEDWMKQLRQKEGKVNGGSRQQTRKGNGPSSRPKREMVRGREAQELNNEWLQRQKMKQDDWMRRQDTVGQQKRPSSTNNAVRGPDTQKVNEDLLRKQQPQQRRNVDKGGMAGGPEAAREVKKGGPRASRQQNANDSQMVSGSEAQRVNEDWLRQQQTTSDEWRRQQPTFPQTRKSDKVSVSGPEAQRVNDEWRRQKAREQERFSKVKRVRREDSPPTKMANPPGNQDSAANDGFQRPKNFKTMVAGHHAKKINDEWLQQTGKDLYEEEIEDAGMAIQDATVVSREPGSEWKYVVENDQDKPLGKRDKRKLNRPGHHLDIQDATVVDNDEKGKFILSQFEEEEPAEGAEEEERVPVSDDTEANCVLQDRFQEASQQQTKHREDRRPHDLDDQSQERLQGEFKDGWFDKRGRTPGQKSGDSVDSDGFQKFISEESSQPVKSVQSDPDLPDLSGINPDQEGNAWGGRLF